MQLSAQQNNALSTIKGNAHPIVRMRCFSISLKMMAKGSYGGRRSLLLRRPNQRVIRDTELLAEIDSCLSLLRCPIKSQDEEYDDSRFAALLYRSNGKCDTLSLEHYGMGIWYNNRSYECNASLLRCIAKILSTKGLQSDSLSKNSSPEMNPKDVEKVASFCDSLPCDKKTR